MKKILALLFSFILPLFLIAQTGSDCINAQVIASLPFNQTGMSTGSMSDIYTASDACGSVYMNGNDYVFSYTPATDMNISVRLANTANFVGVFVADKCFDDPAANCVGNATDFRGNPFIPNIRLTAGTTYFILVSTNAFMGMNQSTPFDIEVKELVQTDGSIKSIAGISGGCQLGTQTMSVWIHNYGADSLYNFNVGFVVPVQGNIMETVTDTILPWDSLYYTFATPVSFSATGPVLIKAFTAITGDTILNNDTCFLNVYNFPLINSFPYNQDYESANTYWVKSAGGSWELGTPASPLIDHTASGTKSWKTNLDSSYITGENSWVESPCFDMSTLLAPVIGLNIWYESSANAYCRIQYSLDEGNTWLNLGTQGDSPNWYNTALGWSGSSGNWLYAERICTELAGVPSVKFRVYFYGGISGTGDGVAFDDFSIHDSPAANLGLVSITGPVSSCGLTSVEAVTVLVVNCGTLTQSSYDLSYSLNGGAFITENVTVPVLPGDTVSYTFATTADLSLPGNNDFVIAVTAPGDTVNYNDTINAQVFGTPLVSAYPYYQDFENLPVFWNAYGTNTSWELGTPASGTINAAASGVNAWKTNLDGNHNTNEDSYVEGPCFDLSSFTDPYIDLDIWYKTSLAGAFITLESSVDGGSTWQTVGANGDPDNWYNGTLQTGWTGSSGQYITATHKLDGLGGQADVKLRIYFNGSYMPADEGFAFDNLKIYNSPDKDLAMLDITAPVSNCGLMDAETVRVVFMNTGIAPQYGFQLGYSADGGTSFVLENYTDTVLPGDTAIYSFSATTDMSIVGSYNFSAFTMLAGDMINANDTVYKAIESYVTIASYPYSENFDGGPAGWVSGGTNSSWALGTPVKTVINTAASAPNAWVTSLTGDHNANENSWVESPCLDMSTLENPYIDFSLWYETSVLGTIQVQASTDNGLTWNTIGANGDTNWYNGVITPGWTGSSSGWITVSHSLDNLAGVQLVKLRVLFNANLVLTAEGLAFDDVHIYDCPLPQASYTYANNSGIVTFTNTSSNGLSYLWDFGDSTTSVQQNPSHFYSLNGNYNVSLTVVGACGDTSVYMQQIIIAGIGELETIQNFTVFPNPSHGQILLLNQSAEVQYPFVEVYDVMGKSIYTTKIEALKPSTFSVVDLKSVKKGIYFMKIISPEKSYLLKLVIK